MYCVTRSATLRKSNINHVISSLFHVQNKYPTMNRGCVSNSNLNIRLVHQSSDIKPGITVDDRRSFMEMYPSIVADLKSFASEYDDILAPTWFESAIKYNVGHGKNNRGLITVLAFKELANKEQLTSENLQKAHRMGWCVELLSGALLALDDIIDGSQTRRKQPCWYKRDEVRLQAINDCLMIENGMYTVMEKYFSKEDYFMNVLEMFRELTFITCIGQVLDVQASKVNITTYTLDKYKSLVRAKSSYGTFSLPVFIAMHMCGIPDPKLYTQTESILFEICYFFQAQNDFEDCYGDPKVTGRIGTDIEDNRCTWLAAVAIERASSAQRKILEECYGQKDRQKAEQVLKIYKELDLVNLFATYEENTCNYIKELVESKTTDVYSKLFLKIWAMFYRKVPLPSVQ